MADAHKSLEQALALDPRCVAAVIQVGVILEEERDLEGAEHWFRRALEVNPESFDAWNDLGMVLHQQGDLKGAKECYEKAVQISPFAADAWSNLGEVHRETGDCHRAAECYRRALAVDPNHVVARENLARVNALMPSAPGAEPQIPIARAPVRDLNDQPRMERMVRTALDGLAAGELSFDQAVAFLLTIEDKGTEAWPLTEALIQLGAERPDEAMAVSGRFMASPRLRQREMFVYAILGAYLKNPERYLQVLVDLARNDYEWVKFAVAESLLAGRARWGASPEGSVEAALGIAVALLDSRDRTVREKVSRYLWRQWIKPLDRQALSQRAQALLSQFEAIVTDS